MKKTPTKRKRPGILVRFYPDDLARLNEVCQDACTPRENFIRRAAMTYVTAAEFNKKAAAPRPPLDTVHQPDPESAPSMKPRKRKAVKS